MAVSSVSNTAAVAAPAVSASAASAKQVDEAQTRFMKLLVTQMQNQDPLNPMDNAEMTSQIAQLNTVSGINQLNTSMQGMLSNFQSTQQMQATGMLGREVLVSGNSMSLAKGQGTAHFDMPQSADSAQILIKDTAGATLRTLEVGALAPGIQTVDWDGKTDAGVATAEGAYKFEITAKRNGVDVNVDTLSVGKVESVSMGASGVSLNLPSIGSVAISAIKQVR